MMESSALSISIYQRELRSLSSIVYAFSDIVDVSRTWLPMISICISLLVIIFALAAVELAWQRLGHFSVDVRLYGAIMHLILAFNSGALFNDRVRVIVRRQPAF